MRYLILFLLSFSCLAGAANADHLKKLSNEKALQFHQFRIQKIPQLYKTISIRPSAAPAELVREARRVAAAEKMLKETDLLSVMRFQDGKIVIDAMSTKMKPDDKIYSMSMVKSLIGYLVGHAVCDGHIKNLNDPVSRYLPEVKGTIYEKVAIGQMINMAAGDQPIWKGKYNIQEYSALVLSARPDERKTILEVLKSKPNKNPRGTGSFRYSNMVTDLIGVALDKAVPGGLEGYMHQKLAAPAGNADPMLLLVDKNDWPISHAFLYATRDDYMRMSIRIMNDFKAASCIGDYLRSQTKNYVKTSQESEGYAAFFWLENARSTMPRVLMKGHGGQRIIIDLKAGTITSMHAIRLNYDAKKLEKILR